MKLRKVKVLRAFFFNREVQPVGKVLDLPDLFAVECLAAKKVEVHLDPASVEPKPVKSDAAKGKDGDAHAGK